jgi:hypothetical protein
MNIPMMLLAVDVDAGAFKKPADGVWKTQFWDVGEGFSVRAIAQAPVKDSAVMDFEWSPHEPSKRDRRLPRQDRVEEAYRNLEFRVFLHYHLAYGFTPNISMGVRL